MAVRVPGKDEAAFVISAVDVTGEAIASAKRNLNDLETHTGKTSERMKSHVEGLRRNWLAAVAGIYAAQQTLAKAWDMAEASAKFEQSMGAFNTMVARVGRNAEEEFAKIRQASAGLVDDQAMVMAANRAIALGIPIENLAELMEIARAKARDMGTDTSQAFNDIATGIGRASPLILDNLGLVLRIEEANKKYAASIGKSVKELTEQDKKMAVLHATMEAGREAVNRHNLAVMTTNEKMQQLKATVKNIELWLGSALIRAAAAGMGVMQGLAAAALAAYAGLSGLAFVVSTLTFQNAKATENYANMKAALAAAADLTSKMANNVTAAFSSAKELAAVMKSEGIVAMGGGGDGDAKAAEKAKKKWDEYVDLALKALIEKYAEAEEFNEKYYESLRKNAEEAMRQGEKLLQIELQNRVDSWESAAQRLKEIEEAQLRDERYHLEQRISAYEDTWGQIFNLVNGIEGEYGEGARMMAFGARGMTDAEIAYQTELEAAYNHYYDMQEAYAFHANYMSIMRQEAIARDDAIEAASAQYRISLLRNTLGMIAGIMYSAYITGNKHSKQMFELYKTFAIAQAIVDTLAGAARALKEYPWPYSMVVAGIVTAAGMMRVAQIASTQPGTAVASAGGSSSGGSTSATTTQAATTTEQTERPINVNVHVYGSFYGNKDELARDIAASIREAERDGVH